MHVHILGICGTFMGGVAALAIAKGHKVSGSDVNVYPPMSTQLEDLGIVLMQGYSAENLVPTPDIVVVGNALSRGNEEVEAMLNQDLPYVSGPEWLREHVLRDRQVIAVAGTHGKTTTSSMVTWILQSSGRDVGFLIGGVPGNFDVSARLGTDPIFVVEADEYDTAFFDKRSKFVHYRPTVAVLNNLEFDHADIFDDIKDIRRQFHHLVRTVPAKGFVVSNADEPNLDLVLQQGCWSNQHTFTVKTSNKEIVSDWSIKAHNHDYTVFQIVHQGQHEISVSWPIYGRHNMANALAAIATTHAMGVKPSDACSYLSKFKLPRRRLQCLFEGTEITVIEDFAHHPTAIQTTLEAAVQRLSHGQAIPRRLVAVFEPRSNSMRLGVHGEQLVNAFAAAQQIYFLQTDPLQWSIEALDGFEDTHMQVVTNVTLLLETLITQTKTGDIVVFMSNGAFGGLPTKFAQAMRSQYV